MTAEALAGRLDAKRHGTGWIARCPAHDDRSPSLSIGVGDTQPVVLHCHAGCTYDEIVSAVGVEPDMLAGDVITGDNLPARTTKATTKREIVATYPYHDEQDVLLYEVVRYEPKTFRQRRPDGKGGWIWNLDGVRHVLYKLPDLRRRLADPEARAYRDQHGIPHDVFVVEGEKDVETLWTRGLIATTGAGGATKWRDDFTAQLVAAGTTSIVVLPDNDDPGRQHAQQVALSCSSAGLTVKILELPGLPAKGDVSDFMAGLRDVQ